MGTRVTHRGRSLLRPAYFRRFLHCLPALFTSVALLVLCPPTAAFPEGEAPLRLLQVDSPADADDVVTADTVNTGLADAASKSLADAASKGLADVASMGLADAASKGLADAASKGLANAAVTQPATAAAYAATGVAADIADGSVALTKDYVSGTESGTDNRGIMENFTDDFPSPSANEFDEEYFNKEPFYYDAYYNEVGGPDDVKDVVTKASGEGVGMVSTTTLPNVNVASSSATNITFLRSSFLRPSNSLPAPGVTDAGTKSETFTIDTGRKSEMLVIDRDRNYNEVHTLDDSEVHTLDGSEVRTLDGSEVHTLDGSEVHTLDGSEVHTLDGSEVHTLDDSDDADVSSIQKTLELKLLSAGLTKGLTVALEELTGGTQRNRRHQGILRHHDPHRSEDGIAVRVLEGTCPPPVHSLPPGLCGAIPCTSHMMCYPRQMCCFNGCTYTCTEPVHPPPVFDWLEDTGTRDPVLDPANPSLPLRFESSQMYSDGGGETVRLPGGCALSVQQYEELKNFMASRSIQDCMCREAEVVCVVKSDPAPLEPVSPHPTAPPH